MRVYRFYIIKDNERNGKKAYELYAVTKNKKFAKRFKQERDMKQFFPRHSKMDDEDYAEYINTRPSHVLGIHKLDTTSVDAQGNICIKQVEVLATEFENDIATNTDVFGAMMTDDYFKGIPKIGLFKENIQDALMLLEFKALSKIYRQMNQFNLSQPHKFVEEQEPVTYSLFDEEYEDFDYDIPDFLADQLGIFVANFHITFKN
jgi:hypothetical protein